MKTILMLTGILQILGSAYFGLVATAPVAPSSIIDVHEKLINENEIYELLLKSLTEPEKSMVANLKESNANSSEIIANLGKRGFRDLNQASAILLCSGLLLVIAGVTSKKPEPAGSGQPGNPPVKL